MSERIGVALFGIGRIGMLHLMNMLASPRVVVRYVVERDLDKARDVVKKYHLTDHTTVLSVDDTSQVFADDRLQYITIWNEKMPMALQSLSSVTVEKRRKTI